MFRGFLVRGRLCRLSVLSVVFVCLLYVQNLIIRFGQKWKLLRYLFLWRTEKISLWVFRSHLFRLSFELFNFNFNKLRDYLGFLSGWCYVPKNLSSSQRKTFMKNSIGKTMFLEKREMYPANTNPLTSLKNSFYKK